MAVAPVRNSMNINAIASELQADSGPTMVAQPNVSPFGWTDGEVGDIRDIISYVQQALNAANRAEAAAATAAASAEAINDLAVQFENSLVLISQQYKDMTDLYNKYLSTWGDLEVIHTDVTNKYNAINVIYSDIEHLRDEVVTYALQAIYRFNSMDEVAASRAIDVTQGACQSMTLMQPSTTVTIKAFSDPTNTCRQLTLLVKQGTGANKVVWDGKIKWNNSREPVLSYIKDKIDIITLLTIDSGVTWMGFYNGGWFDV